MAIRKAVGEGTGSDIKAFLRTSRPRPERKRFCILLVAVSEASIPVQPGADQQAGGQRDQKPSGTRMDTELGVVVRFDRRRAVGEAILLP